MEPTLYPHRATGKPRGPRPLGPLFVFFGIVLPLITLTFELVTHASAGVLSDPIPSWWYVLLVAAVPASNALVWWRLRTSKKSTPDAWLHRLAGASVAISAIYMLIYLPWAPFAAIGLLYLGFGLLPLTPVIAFGTTVRAWLKLPTTEGGRKRFWPGFAIGFAAMALPFGWNLVTHELMVRAATGSVEQRAEAITWLRRIGNERAMIESCYRASRWAEEVFRTWGSFFDRPWQGRSNDFEQFQAVFYRVTGEPYNSRPVPASVSLNGRGGRGMWNFDANLGGERVADKVAGLTLESSRLDGKVDATGLTSYTEWTLVFKNIAANASEARAQIELPPGGVVSRLTLWIDGQPNEAAFGSRAQVRAAYREIAVVQRRDPVLVNTCGPDRVLVQCFPVPANGGEMKIRVGFTAPLRLVDSQTALVEWPRLIETNFESSESLRHAAWVESNAPFTDGQTTARRTLDDRAFNNESALRVVLPEAARDCMTNDPTDPSFLIRQTIETAAARKPRKVVWVIDGSQEMQQQLSALTSVVSGAKTVPDAAFFAGDELARWEPNHGPFAAWLGGQQCRGGANNLPALEAAWDAASAEPESAVIWIHGPQPILLSSIEPLLQRIERSKERPWLFDLAVGIGPNRIAEKLDSLVWQRVLDGNSPGERLAALLHRWSGLSPQYILNRQRLPRNGFSASTPTGSRHIARLWGREEIERLRANPTQLVAATKLAVELQLVTPVSGAVVLERQEQYARHGLQPVDPQSVPMVVPEPATIGLLVVGAAWLAGRRPRKYRRPTVDA